MTRTTVVAPPQASAGWPGSAASEVVLLRFEQTAAERAVVDRWVERMRPAGVTVTSVTRDGLAPDGIDDDVAVLPVRVAWTSTDASSRAETLTNLVHTHARLDRAQARTLRRAPDRCQVVVGEPASMADLRQRFDRRTGGVGSLLDFVWRQAVLALDRAERRGAAHYKLPRMVPDEVRADRAFARGAEALAQQIGRPTADVREQAGGYLDEMAAAHSRVAIDMFARFGRFLLRAYDIEVDRDRLEELRALNREHTLVFLPNHRSYLDPFVVRSTLLAHGFPANHCFAGNNMAWWPMGDWTRRTGNIILRRSIGDDAVYKFVLREYLGYLMRKRLNLEWYIEGGRTRTGKLRPPKYGLLTYLVDAFDALEDGRDVHLVPVSIVYDGLPEVQSLTQEQIGGSKKPETASWLLRYPQVTGRGFGSVHVCIGDPLSLRSALGPADADDRRLRVEKVAFEVCHRINRATPVTPTALVTLALLGVDDRALTLAEVERVIEPLLSYLHRRELPVTGDLEQAGQVRKTLDALERSGVVRRFGGGTEEVWGIAQDRHLEAAFYRNSVVHFLVERAIVELVLAAAALGRLSLESEAWEEALELRDLLKFEFFFPEKEEFSERLKAELTLIDPQWREKISDPDGAARILADARPHLAHRTLHSYLEAYAVTAERLAAHDAREEIDTDALAAECFGVARQRLMQQRLRDSDALSTEVVRAAIRLASYRGLMGPGGQELADRRRAFAEDMSEILNRLDGMRDLAMRDFEAAAVRV